MQQIAENVQKDILKEGEDSMMTKAIDWVMG